MIRNLLIMLFVPTGCGWSGSLLAQAYVHREFIVPDGVTGSKFGWSIDVAEGQLVVGAPHGGAQQAGRMYVYSGLSSQTPAVELANFGDAEFDAVQTRVGATVATNGEVVAVASSSNLGGSEYSGPDTTLVTLYAEEAGTWMMLGRVVPPEGVSHAPGTFGRSLSMSEDRLAVGGGRLADGTGVVCLYARDAGGPGNWGLERLFTAAEVGAPASNAFGHAVALGNDVLIVGDPKDDELGDDAGAVYCFKVSDMGEWDLSRKQLASDGVAGDRSGTSLALDNGARAVVGSPTAQRNGISSGVVHVYERHAGGIDNWGEVGTLLPSMPQDQMAFGTALDVAGDRVAVGSPGEDLSPQGTDGSVEVFAWDGGSWPLLQRIVPWELGLVSPVGRCGTSLRLHEDLLLMGAPWGIMQDGGGGGSATGGVLLFADPALGLSHGPQYHQLRSYPVPAVEQVDIALPEGTQGTWTVELIDAYGRVVRQGIQRMEHNNYRAYRAGASAGPHILRFTEHHGPRILCAKIIWL